jgi:predicted phosphodiesterase
MDRASSPPAGESLVAPLREVAVIGDIHGEIDLFRRALAQVDEVHPQIPIWAVGDVVDGRSDRDVAACLRLIGERNILCLRGNHERWFLTGLAREKQNATRSLPLAQARRLLALPSSRVYASARGRIWLTHGFGEADEIQATPSGLVGDAHEAEAQWAAIEAMAIDWVVCGHTHRSGVFRLGPVGIINAGCLRPHRDPCWVHLDFVQGVVTFRHLGDDGGTPRLTTMPML